jgi:hypothetical protein
MNNDSLRQRGAAIWGLGAVGVMVLVGILTVHQSVWAQSDPIQIHQTQVKAITVRQQTQKNEENWAQKKTELKARYQSLTSEKASLEREKDVLEKQIAILQARQAEAERKIAETALIRERLHSHLDAVIERLEQKIDRDLPFLPAERSERMGRVKTAMVQPDSTIAEKCRQVMEALKVETEYGQTVEVYQEAIRIDEQVSARPVMADILRVGRLALFWRTPDGKTVGHWDRVSGKWVSLPKKYRRHINDAAEMALKQRTVEMVNLPLGRIVNK